MIVSDINRNRHGGRNVFVYTDSPETKFSGRVQANKKFLSPWVRLTGPVVDAAPIEDIQLGSTLEEWLPRDPKNPAELAVAEGVVVAFPVSNGTRRPDWKLIPGPATAKLSEVAVPQAVAQAEAA